MGRALVQTVGPVPAPNWFRDFESECLDWWADYCTAPATTMRNMVAILVARFGRLENSGQALCEIVPVGYIAPANSAAIREMESALASVIKRR